MSEIVTLAYERVESKIEALVQNGTLHPDDRVPSVREICRSEGGSKITAMRAHSKLKAKSLVHAPVWFSP